MVKMSCFHRFFRTIDGVLARILFLLLDGLFIYNDVTQISKGTYVGVPAAVRAWWFRATERLLDDLYLVESGCHERVKVGSLRDTSH